MILIGSISARLKNLMGKCACVLKHWGNDEGTIHFSHFTDAENEAQKS